MPDDPAPAVTEFHPMSRYRLAEDEAARYTRLHAAPPTIATVSAALLVLSLAIEGRSRRISDDALSGMAIAHDQRLLELAMLRPASEEQAVLRSALLASCAPVSGTFGLLPEALAAMRAAGVGLAVDGDHRCENKQ